MCLVKTKYLNVQMYAKNVQPILGFCGFFFLQCSPNADLFSMMFEKEIIKNRAEALLWLRGYNISSLFKADLITLDIYVEKNGIHHAI